MTDIDDATEPLDGRVARRRRNIDAVLDVVLELFAEDSMFPTIEQAASRSGLSLRSLYRYFADPGELLEATIRRSDEVGSELARLHSIGEGPFADRLEDFVTMRLRLHEGIGPVFRATLANAARRPRIREELAANRERIREQFERHFAPELDRRPGHDRDFALAAGDLLSQLESIDFLRRHRGLSVTETHATLSSSLRALLG